MGSEARQGEQPDSNLLDLLLDAQRRYADARSRYFQNQVEYALAVKNVHFEKGTLMEFNDIALAEGPWPGSHTAAFSSRPRIRHALRRPINYILGRH